jgi:purine-binding chemotaxis protein CheW
MDNKLQDVIKKQQNQKVQPNKKDEDTLQVVGFNVGEEEFAVSILNIQEIIKPIDYTRVPGTPDYVLGVFNLRGSVLPLISLRLKFALSDSKYSDDTRFIVIKNGASILGFVIDKLTQAFILKESEIDHTLDMQSEQDGIIYGIGKREDKIITILKAEGLLKREF